MPLYVPKEETRVDKVKEVFALSCAGMLDEYEEGIAAALRELPVGDAAGATKAVCREVVPACRGGADEGGDEGDYSGGRDAAELR